MKIAISKNELVKALDTVSKAAPVGKVIMQILEGVLIEAQDRQLCITCNNLDTAIRYTTECEVLDAGSTVVNTKLFSDIIRKMPDEEIDISANDKEMSIECGKVTMKVPVIDPKDFPGMPNVDGKITFAVEHKVFSEMVGGVAFAVSEGADRPELTGIKVDIKDGEMNVVAIDGFMMAWRKSLVNSEDVSVLLSGKILESVLKPMGDVESVNVSAGVNMAMLTTHNIQAIIRAIEGEFLNYRRFMNTQFTTTIKLSTRTFLQSIERAMLIFESNSERDKISSPVIVTLTKSGLRMVIDSTRGSFDEEVPGIIDGDKIKIGLDPRKLRACLGRIEDKEVQLNFSGDEKPVFITPSDGDRFVYMILPVRIKQ